MKKKEQKAMDIMFEALEMIAEGMDGPSQMRDIAAKALKQVIKIRRDYGNQTHQINP